MSASLRPKQKERKSFIIHLSQPVREYIKRFSLALLLLIGVFIVFINQNDSRFSQAVRSHILDAVSPVLQGLAMPFQGVVHIQDSIQNFFLTFHENKELRKSVATLEKKLLHFDQLLTENKRLKNLLTYVEGLHYRPITAKVIGTTVDPFVHSILINAGAKEQVQKGQAVVNEEGLVGHITEVGEHTSRVLLLSDINSRIPVISSESREHAILAGQNTNTPKLRYLHKETTLQGNEQIMTSGAGEVFPSGILVGTVKQKNNLFYVNPVVQFHRLEAVSVLQPSEKQIEQPQ